MGQAWVVPYKDRKNNRTTATFQLGYRGFVQLAIRSGQYRKINVLAIKEGELVSWNPLEEELDIEMIRDEATRAAAPTCGYFAMFQYVNGFKKALYWSREKMHAHAMRYSQGYAYDVREGKATSFWSKDFDSMAIKTMLRQLISKWGVMSVEMLSALEADGRQSDGTYSDAAVMDADFLATPAPAQIVDVETSEVVEEQTEAPAPKPRRRKYECPQLSGKAVTESECKACAYREGCPAHDDAPEA
jgi:recombination protein RecT